MWIINKYGMFSVITNRYAGCDVHPVSVRARCRDHLERLLNASGIQGEIISTLGSGVDYPYRMLMCRDAWIELARWMAEEAADTVNVKASIEKEQGHDSPLLRFAYRVHDLSRQLETRPRP